MHVTIEVVYAPATTQALRAGATWRKQTQTALPDGKKEMRDALKLIVTQVPHDLGFLRQSPPKDLPAHYRDGAVANPLEAMMARAGLNGGYTKPIQKEADGWITIIRSIRVVKPQ